MWKSELRPFYTVCYSSDRACLRGDKAAQISVLVTTKHKYFKSEL